MGKLPKDRSLEDRSSLSTPPRWIRIPQAGKWLSSAREARKRAVIRLLDDLRTGVRPSKTPLV